MDTRPTIGVLSPFVGCLYYGGLISGIAQAASARGARLMAIQTNVAAASGLDAVLRRHPTGWGHLSGCVILAHAVTDDYDEVIRSSGKPIVLVSREMAGIEAPIVQPENRAAVRGVVNHLIQHGHTRIAFTGHLRQDDYRERYEGYLDALHDAGIEPDPSLFYNADEQERAELFDDRAGLKIGARMLAAGMPSTAIVAGDDELAIGIMRALSQAGLTLPRDQAIVGFDDHDDGAATTPTLSTVRQDYGAVGRRAGNVLLDMLTGVDVTPRRHEVATSFVTRESCGCIDGRISPQRIAAMPSSNAATPSSEEDRITQRLEATLPPASDPAARARTVRRARSLILSTLAPDGAVDAASWQSAVRAAAESLYDEDPRGETLRSVLRVAHEKVLETHRSLPVGDLAALDALADRESELVMALSFAQSRDQLDVSSYMQGALSTQYDVAMDLLRSDGSDPRWLSWLRSTSATAACLGLWSTPRGEAADSELLHVVGSFDRRTPDAVAVSGAEEPSSVPATTFPPSELLLLADEHSDEIVFVLQVASPSGRWGVMAAVGPIERRISSARQGINQWVAWLAAALDRQADVAALERAYERERNLVEDVRLSGERYALAAEAASGGLWDWDLVTGVFYYSPRWKAMLQCEEHQVGTGDEEWFGRVHPADLAALRKAIDDHLQGSAPDLEVEHRVRMRDGSYRWVLCRALAVRNDDGDPLRMVGSLTDVHERRQLEEQLRHSALYDGLTGLPNRSLFLDRLRQTMARAKRRKDYRFAVLFLDLDGFKLVNDSLGHLAGDSLLSGVALRIGTDLRPSDTASRFGGDEFAILLDDISSTRDAVAVAERLQSRLMEPLTVGGHEIVVTASVGIASNETPYEEAEDVLRDADTAMYIAKAQDKGRHAVFDHGMHVRAIGQLRLESELRHAVETDQLRLHYQPIVALHDGSTVGYEALVRWQHPERGLLAPAEFLAAAESMGLMVPLGQWVVHEACRQLSAWRADGASDDLRVSINLSNRQFWHDTLLDDLHGSLKEAGLEPRHVVLEITETVVMHNAELAERMLADLHRDGFALHIDDFGTGYSSLQALHQFPIEALKVDRSFVARLGTDPRSTELVRTIVMMARNLGVEVIAEGIETDDQRRRLEALGCALGQGFLFAAPHPAEEAAAFTGPAASSNGVR